MLRLTLTTLILSVSVRNVQSFDENSTLPHVFAGIPPCLFPPFRNLVYNFEEPVLGRPGLRTGCYVRADSSGAPFPYKTILPLSTIKVLRYYAIDSTGIQQTVSSYQKTVMCLQKDQFNTSNGSNCMSFDFHQVCFPMLCYSSQNMWAKSCFYPFLRPGSTSFDAHHTSQLDSEQENSGHSASFPKKSLHFGESSHEYDTSLYCVIDENGVQKSVPVMSKQFPFGVIQNLKQIPYSVNVPGSSVVLAFEHYGIDVMTNFGCDVVLPLDAPFDKFMHRFWYRNENFVQVTIGINQTGMVKIRLPTSAGGGSYVTFTFQDLCFPEECYIERKMSCTDKFGGSWPLKSRVVKHVSAIDGKTTIISENTV